MTQDEKKEKLAAIRQHKELLIERYKICPIELKQSYFEMMTALIQREYKIMWTVTK